LAVHDKKDEKHGKEEAKHEDKPKADDKKGTKESEAKPAIPEGWDSAKGPVLKVLFVSFATQ
ncbi:MAG: hypothetical protein H7Y17_09225, partial [Chlorobia bacterium]|nr:hypothetical protein [Fimbriimonadaceae bacterium]